MMIKNFGRVCEVMTNQLKFSMDEFNIEATIPFDYDALPNEAEIKIWNLSNDTLHNIKPKEVLMLNAGYRGDVGLLLHGYISSVKTRWESVDKITTISVLDSEDISKREVKQIAYAKGTLGSTIMKQMASFIGLPIAQFELQRDYRYKEGYSASGKITEIISKVAEDCQTRVFISKGKLYIRNLRRGADDLFRLNTSTGLIGTPELFQEKTVSGYNLKSQLQYRIATASVIELTSQVFKGKLHVRSGTHRISRSGDFVTEVEAVI